MISGKNFHGWDRHMGIHCQYQWHLRSGPCSSQVSGPFLVWRRWTETGLRNNATWTSQIPFVLPKHSYVNFRLIGRVPWLSRHWLYNGFEPPWIWQRQHDRSRRWSRHRSWNLTTNYLWLDKWINSVQWMWAILFQPTRKPHRRLPLGFLRSAKGKHFGLAEFPELNCLGLWLPISWVTNMMTKTKTNVSRTSLAAKQGHLPKRLAKVGAMVVQVV